MNIFTLRRVALPLLLLLGAAQAHSQNWNLVWREDFGVAEDSVIKNFPDPSMSVPNHAFYEDQRKCAAGFEHWDAAANANVCDKFEIVPGTRGVCGTIDDGYYGITNSTWWAYNRPHTEGCAGDGNTSHFMAGRDHTGNKNGAMLVVNTGTGAGEVVYQQDVEFDLCDARKYRFVIYTASITNMGYTPVFPNLTMKVINSTTGKLIDVLETGDIKNWEYDETIGFKDPGGFGDAKAMREWQEFYIEFTAKAGDKLTLQVTNNCKGGTGNDFVLDDISLLRYDDENVPVPEISATSVAQAGAADACSYLAQFAVPQQVLADWKKIYDEVFFLWQQSTDEGISWQNVTSVSGVDKTEVEIELDKSKNTIFRVIITGGSTAALAEEQALYIAEHGGPKGGCAYYSISNTLSAKPAADCTFSADLMSVFDEDFGTVPGGSAVENPYVPLFTFAEKGLTAGNYAITANTKNTELNSWDGIPEFTDHTGNADGGMLYCRTNKDFGTIYERSIAGPFCKCKSYIFSFYAAALGDWSTLNLTGQVLDNKGNELASLPIKEGNNGKPGNWRHYQFEFSPSDAADALVVKIFSTDPLTEAYGTQVVIDDISLRVCGVHIPQDSICIDNTAGLTSLLDFDCTEKPGHTINLSSMAGWAKDYPNAVVLWQRSADGGASWETLAGESGKSVDFETEDGGTILYRAILAEDAATAAVVAAGGKGDGCGVFLITNTVTLSCTAQCHFSEDMLVLWKDDFGSVPAGTRKQCAYLKGHTFLKDMKKSVDDGQYAVVSRMEDAGTWFAAMDGTDHTGNADGGFLVINIDKDYKDKIIYEQELGFTTCPGSSYFFSLWASSISKRVANGDKTGVLCNLTMEIVDAASGDVLGSIETGSMPNATSLKGQVPWMNYGVSFTSAGEKVKLRIYDHAGNGDKGNDLALDDISLIACEEAAPEVKLDVDGSDDVTGLCGVDTYTLQLGDISGWEKIYNADVYCLWQRSADGGETWENLDANSGVASQFGTLEVTAERNMQEVNDTMVNVGYRYRVIVAGPESDVTKEIATQGYPSNGCYLYRISNEMTVRCECVAPELQIDGEETLDICQSSDPVALRVMQTNNAVLDTVFWFSKAPDANEWKLVEKYEGATLTADALTYTVTPTDSISYLCLAYSETCASDSMVFILNVDKPIVLADLASTTLCVGSDTTYSATVTSGFPVKYVWNGTEGTETSYEVANLATDQTITLVAKGAVCVSEEKTATVEAEAEVQLASKVDDAEICALQDTVFDSKAVAQNIKWYQTYTKSNVFNEIAGANTAKLACVPDSSRTYKVVASGDKCPSKELTFSVTVKYPAKLTASISEKAYCKGGSSTITVTLDHVTSLQWMAKAEGENTFSEVKKATYADTDTQTSETFTPSVSTDYMVKTAGDGCAGAQSDVMSVTVEQPIDFTLSASKAAICQGDELTLNYSLASGAVATSVFTANAAAASGADDLLADGKLAVSPTSTTTYSLALTGTLCATAVTKTAEVAVEIPTTLSALTAAEKICVGEEAALAWTSTPANAPVHIMQSADGVDFHEVAKLEKPAKTTWYKVESEAGNACEKAVTNVVKVEVEDSIRFAIAEPASKICSGATVASEIKLATGNAASMGWNKNGNALAAAAKMTDAPTDAQNTYEATVAGDKCPAVTKQFAVEVETPAAITALTASAGKICVNGEVTLSVEQANAAALVWEKRNAGGTFAQMTAGAQEETLTDKPTAATEYRVSTSGADVCANATSPIVKVTVEDSVSVSLPADTFVCPGATVQLDAAVGGKPTEISWEKNDGAGFEKADSRTASIRFKPSGTVTYRLTANADVCPKAEAEVTVNVEEVPELKLEVSNDSLCEGEEVTLTATFVNDTSITWLGKYAGGNVFSPMGKGSATYSEVPDKSTVYKVTASTEHGCKVESGQVGVQVSERIVAVASDTFFCEGGSAQLSVLGKSGYTYSWFADAAKTELLGTGAKIDVEPSATTTYTLVVANGSCKEEMPVTVEVLPNPAITAIEDRAARELEIVADGGNGALEFNYGGDDWTSSNMFTGFYFGTQYTIRVRDAKGCLADTTFTTSTYDIKIPQVLTPNGDGYNDLFEIVNLSKYPVSVIRIYDRFGKKLLERKGGDYTGWDGTYLGYPMPSTDYWYEIWVEELDKYFTGHFTLVRK